MPDPIGEKPALGAPLTQEQLEHLQDFGKKLGELRKGDLTQKELDWAADNLFDDFLDKYYKGDHEGFKGGGPTGGLPTALPVPKNLDALNLKGMPGGPKAEGNRFLKASVLTDYRMVFAILARVLSKIKMTEIKIGATQLKMVWEIAKDTADVIKQRAEREMVKHFVAAAIQGASAAATIGSTAIGGVRAGRAKKAAKEDAGIDTKTTKVGPEGQPQQPTKTKLTDAERSELSAKQQSITTETAAINQTIGQVSQAGLSVNEALWALEKGKFDAKEVLLRALGDIAKQQRESADKHERMQDEMINKIWQMVDAMAKSIIQSIWGR